MIQNESIQSVYVKLMWLFTLGLYVCIPLNIGLISLLYNAILALSVAVILLTAIANLAQKQNTKISFVQIALITGMAVCVVLSLMQTQENLSFSVHGMGILGFFEMVGTVFVVSSTPCTKDLKRFIFGVSIVSSLVMVVFSFMPSIAYSSILADSLNLGFSNPNETAIYLMSNICTLVLFFNTVKRRLYKGLLLVLIGYLIYLLYCTGSRTALIATVLVIVYQVFVRSKWVLPKWVIPVAVVFPVVFLVVYSLMFQAGFTNIEIMGKPFFSGREDDFVRQLSALKSQIFFGDVGIAHFTNLHNGPLAILASMGGLGYGLYFLFTLYTLFYYHRGIHSKSQNIALIVILAVFVHSSAEATFLVGGAHYSIIVATFYLLLKEEEEAPSFIPNLKKVAPVKDKKDENMPAAEQGEAHGTTAE